MLLTHNEHAWRNPPFQSDISRLYHVTRQISPTNNQTNTTVCTATLIQYVFYRLYTVLSLQQFMKFFCHGRYDTETRMTTTNTNTSLLEFHPEILADSIFRVTEHICPKDEGCTLNRAIGACLPDDIASILEDLNLHQQPF